MIALMLAAVVGQHCPQNLVQPYYQQQVQQVYAQPVGYLVYAPKDPDGDKEINELRESLKQVVELQRVQAQQFNMLLQAQQNAGVNQSGQQNPGGGSQVSANAWAVLNAKCAKCHTGDAAKGGFDLSKKPLSMDQMILIDSLVKTGQMPPPPAKQLDEEEYAAITAWVHADPKAVRAALKKPKSSLPPPAAPYPGK